MPLLPGPQGIRRRDDWLPAGPLCFAGDRPPAALIRPAVDYLTDRCAIATPAAGAAGSPGSPASDTARRVPTPPNRLPEIRFVMAEDLPNESYELSVGSDGIRIRASSRSGLFYGAVTLASAP